MGATHVAVGVSATSAMAALTTLLTGYHSLDGAHAAAAAWIVVTGLGGLGALAAWFIAWRWPKAPPLPFAVNVPTVFTQPTTQIVVPTEHPSGQ